MRFAFAGIDFLGDVFLTLVDRGWTPVKLFSRPCDGVYDHNDVVVRQARSLKIPIQLSRIRIEDLEEIGRLGCEALVVAGYPWLVKGWEPHLRYGLNIHPSPLPVARGPYPLFRAILDGLPGWGISAHKLAPSFDTGDILAQDVFPTAPDENHDTLLVKCQLGAKRIAAAVAADLPALWGAATPQAGGSYWARATEGDRTLDFGQPVEAIMRKVRAFGSIECLVPLGVGKVFVRQAQGWTEAHQHRPGTVVHQYRRTVVVAARDGYISILAWSTVAPEQARDFGR
jgi:methionyl-tRNA formyltransferase